MKDVFFKPSKDFYGSMEAEIHWSLFNRDVWAIGRKCGEVYARRCTQHIENLPEEMIAKLQEATLLYLIDFLDEHEDELELPTGLILDEETDPAEIMHWVRPVLITYDKGVLSDEEAPPAISIKLMFTAVPDEFLEWVIRDNMIVYIGEYDDISPWNDKIMKKKWNYINAI